MTISSTTRKSILSGNDVTTSFPFAFKVFATTDLQIVKTTAGTEQTLALNSDYSVSLNADQNANPGGTVTYPLSGSPLATGSTLAIVSDVSPLQETDLISGGGFYPQTVEDMADRAVILVQQDAERFERAITVPVSETGTTLQLPSASERASKNLLFDSNGNVAVGGLLTVAALAGNITYTQSGTGAVTRTIEERLRDEIYVTDFGAVGDDVTDNLAAFDLAFAALEDWQTLVIPKGQYRLSGTWIIQNNYRMRIRCDGVLKPYGAFDDYLVKITNSSPDTIIKSMALNIVVHGMTLDCEWQCRGITLEKVYDSNFYDIHVWRPYGHGIYIPMAQEISLIKPVIYAGKPRVNATIDAATDWSAATTYAEGTYVKRNYADYDAGTAYTQGDKVNSGGYLYRNIVACTGNTPATNADYWERIPYEYYVSTSLAGNTNKDPHNAGTDYTTRSATDTDWYWKPVYRDEAALEIVGNSSSSTIDNIKVWNLISRSNAQNTVVRIDNPQYSFPCAKIEFYAPQLHAITVAAYIDAFNNDTDYTTPYGGLIVAPPEGKLIHAVHTTGLKIFGGQLQCGDLPWCKGLTCGTLGISGNAPKTFLIGTYFEGTASGSNHVGISILPSVETSGSNWAQAGTLITMSGTKSFSKLDFNGETEHFQVGQTTLPKAASSVAVTFDRPFAATPKVLCVPKGNLRGLSYNITGISTTGFTIEVTGRYVGPVQSAAFTAGGGVNQTDTYTHSFNLQDDGYILLGLFGDAGANYRIAYESTGSDADNTVIKAPAAPAVDVTQKWAAFWEEKAPVAIQFGWTAEVEQEL